MVECSNLTAAKIIFQFKSTKISLRKSEQRKNGALSLIASFRAVVVGEGEETRRETIILTLTLLRAKVLILSHKLLILSTFWTISP